MSKSQRTKGAAGEREFCKLLAVFGFPEAHRLLGQARDGGGDVPTPPLLWEVKRRKGLAVHAFVEQAVAAVEDHAECDVPAVAMRADNKEWLVLMRAKDILPILRTYIFDRNSTEAS